MYLFIVFFHVIGAILLGSFLAFPVVFTSLLSRSGNELIVSVKQLIGITRFSHYALILIIITGGWMVIGYSTYPSKLWVILSLVLLLFLGTFIGIIQKGLKSVIRAEDPDNALQAISTKLNIMGWVTFACIIIVVCIMTNRSLFI